MNNFDDMKLAVEALSGGKNTVIFDDIGMPSVMVVLPKMISLDICTGDKRRTHPAFIVDGVEKEKVALSKYHNIIMNDRAYSLPMQKPAINIDFTESQTACRKKGEGWGLTPFSLFGAISLWCKKNGTIPFGNNSGGKDVTHPHERGVTYLKSASGITPTATGSGPATWYHDHTPFGIADLNGNIYDWCAGMRLVMGEIQIIPYANCMRATCDIGENSSEWKAINASGSLVEPGVPGTLKFDYVNNEIILCTRISSQTSSGKATFESISTDIGLNVPQILKELALFPADTSGYDGDYFYINNAESESLPLRGGCYNLGLGSGIFCTKIVEPRGYKYYNSGFRSAYYGEF